MSRGLKLTEITVSVFPLAAISLLTPPEVPSSVQPSLLVVKVPVPESLWVQSSPLA